MTDILVPPWNRVGETVLPHLPGRGFGALSTFHPGPPPIPGLDLLHCDLDIIDLAQWTPMSPGGKNSSQSLSR